MKQWQASNDGETWINIEGRPMPNTNPFLFTRVVEAPEPPAVPAVLVTIDHIRGPWEHDSRNIYDSTGEVVCRADWDMNSEDGSAGRWEARAKLMAAVPAMLALLQRLADWRVNVYMSPGRAEDEQAGLRQDAAALMAKIVAKP